MKLTAACKVTILTCNHHSILLSMRALAAKTYMCKLSWKALLHSLQLVRRRDWALQMHLGHDVSHVPDSKAARAVLLLRLKGCGECIIPCMVEDHMLRLPLMPVVTADHAHSLPTARVSSMCCQI